MGGRTSSKGLLSNNELDFWLDHILGLATDNRLTCVFGRHYHSGFSSDQPSELRTEAVAWNTHLLVHYIDGCFRQCVWGQVPFQARGLSVR